MTKSDPNSGFKVAISRDSFLSACKLLLRTVRSKKAQSEEVTFYFDKEGFRFAWGEVNVGVSAEGSWPQKVTIPGRDFLAIAKFPPAGNPLTFEIRDKRFNCSTWSCACYMEESPDGRPQPELFPATTLVAAQKQRDAATAKVDTTREMKGETAASQQLKALQQTIRQIRRRLERDFFNEIVPDEGPVPEEPKAMHLMSELLKMLKEEAEETGGLLTDQETNLQQTLAHEAEPRTVLTKPDPPVSPGASLVPGEI